MSFHFKFFPQKNDVSFISPDLRDKDRTCITETVKSRDKYTWSKFPCDPVQKTGPMNLQLGEY